MRNELAQATKAAFTEGRGIIFFIAKKGGLQEWLEAEKRDRRLEFRLIDGKTDENCPPRVKLLVTTATLSPDMVRRVKANMPADAKFHPLPISNSEINELLAQAYTKPAPRPEDSISTSTTTDKNGEAGHMNGSVVVDTPNVPSDAAKRLATFAGGLANAKNAADLVLQELDFTRGQNRILKQRVQELETQVATSPELVTLRQRNTELQERVTALNEIEIDRDLHKEQAEKSAVEVLQLGEQLKAAQQQATEAQTELQDFRQNAANFMAMLNKK